MTATSQTKPARDRAKPQTRKFMQTVQPTGVERTFGEHEVIVSKTDPKGIITYVNPLFLRLADMTEEEAIGAPHSVVRHPDMPRAVFHLLWDRLLNKQEIFAYVVNMAKNGDHYWVLAHVTPSINSAGQITGLHSNRRKPTEAALAVIKPIYQKMCEIEANHGYKKAGMEAAAEFLNQTLTAKGLSYDEFIFSL